jgi:hypothetical protein
VVTVFEVPPLTSDAFLTTLHPLLENVLQTVDHFEIFCRRAPFSCLEKLRNGMGRDLDYMAETDQWNLIRTSVIQSRSCPVRFLGFSKHENGALRLLLHLTARSLLHVFEKWVERCKKRIACQGRYFEKDRHHTFTKFRLEVIR